MIEIKNYTYDPKRLIFYSNCLDQNKIEYINSCFPITDNSDITLSQLMGYDARNIPLKEGGVSQIGICLTDNCNLRCKYCSNSSTSGKMNYLTKQMIKDFVTDALKKWVIRKSVLGITDSLRISFTGGGEPTYDWNLFVSTVNICEDLCATYNVPYTLNLTTNGVLSNEQIDYIKKHFKTIMVSYDGCPKIQQKHRPAADGLDKHKQIEDAIRKFAAESIYVTIRTTIFYEDIKYLRDMADYLYNQLYFSDWSVMTVNPVGRGNCSKIFNLENVKEFLMEYIELKKYVVDRYRGNVSCPHFSPAETVFYCGGITILGGALWLMPNGQITTCVEECPEKPYVGFVDTKGVHYFPSCSDVFLQMTQEKMAECKECIAYRFCKGGCPITHLRYQKLDRENLDCEIIKEYWEHIFSEIISGNDCFSCHGEKHNFEGIGTVIKLEVN